MSRKRSWLGALLCVALGFQLAIARDIPLIRRQDNASPETTAAGSQTEPSSISRAEATLADATASQTATANLEADAESTDPVENTRTSSKTTATEPPDPASTEITTNGPIDESDYRNVTIPEGQLPLNPELTPGWGVAGATLLTTGLVYTLIGVKHKGVHTFFSSAYLTALAIAVLIVYVMKPPIDDALQGGYVAATILSACLLGAASTFFKDLTEGLGCAFGGFSFAMWLLCLVPGGLLGTVASKAIFIACFSLVGFALYFSHWTRDWTLIIMISFGGATATVLGIDCFSRAGLKEFWVYVWDLNEDLFPDGATTYPVTKGIRVETAAIVIIFLFGIISQIKLWRIVREQKEKRAAAAAAQQEQQAEEDDDLARHLEEANTRDRRQWERVYGNGETRSSTISRGSRDVNAEAEKRCVSTTSTPSKPNPSTEVIEMKAVSNSSRKSFQADPLMAGGDGMDGKVTVRVVEDDFAAPADEALESAPDHRSINAEDADYDQVHVTHSKRASIASPVPPSPQVVPLPFTVPADDDARSSASRSSKATFADDEEAQEPVRKHRSLAKRLSQNSASLLRSMSPRSNITTADVLGGQGDSSDELVSPTRFDPDGDDRSIAATLDGESLSASNRNSAVDDDAVAIAINAQLSGEEGKLNKSEDGIQSAQRDQLGDLIDPVEPQQPLTTTDPVDTPQVFAEVDATPDVGTQNCDVMVAANAPEMSEKPDSVASTTSTPISLTKDKLPRSLSRVAMSYRTNEWAKHLGKAELPQPDELVMAESASRGKNASEKPAPVMVDDLRLTAEDTIQPPSPAIGSEAIRRSDSQASQLSNRRSVVRSGSNRDIHGSGQSSPTIANHPNALQRQGSTGSLINLTRVTSTTNVRRISTSFQPIAEENDLAPGHTPMPEEIPGVSAYQSQPGSQLVSSQSTPVHGGISYSSPQTLLGQRETFLRHKSQGNLLIPSPEPALSPPGPSSEAGSLYEQPVYAQHVANDLDDMPLSQRKHLMRQSSLQNVSGMTPAGVIPHRHSAKDLANLTTYKTHQPKRESSVPSPAARQAQLAQFRQSVAIDMAAGSPMMVSSPRETPFASTTSLLAGRESEVQRSLELQRNVLMGQREAEAQRREANRQQQDWANRAFDERMRSGDLLEAHREAMRKMQNSAKK